MSDIQGMMFPAPAKLNLFLHITGRRSDGYHLLQTVFQFLDVADELSFQPREDGKIVRHSNIVGVAEADDLTVRAARLLQHFAGISAGVEIYCHKHLPQGGGLGGGSSDAATTLLVLDRLWSTGLDEDSLADLGARLGADVPVFIRGRAAFAEGIGEQLSPVELPEPWYLVVVPGVTISTAEIFEASDLTRNCAPITIRDFLAGEGVNVCQPVVVARYPEVAKALEWLGQYAPARMTGTGSSVFAAFESQGAAMAALAELPARWQGLVSRGCNRSPLHKMLACMK
jgi:4-diphosphocytidyl-2-C-methyl-D-erythritol kinase